MEKKNISNWYILFVRGGFERQIINNIYKSLKNHQLEEEVEEIKILEAFNSKTGKTKNLLSSYLFVSCKAMRRELLTAFYSVQGVISFLNHDKRDFNKNPVPLSTLEANNLLLIGKKKDFSSNSENKNHEQSKPRDHKLLFRIGDLIIVKEGFFKNHRGSVTKVDLRREMITINIDFFGRMTPVSIKSVECEKV